MVGHQSIKLKNVGSIPAHPARVHAAHTPTVDLSSSSPSTRTPCRQRQGGRGRLDSPVHSGLAIDCQTAHRSLLTRSALNKHRSKGTAPARDQAANTRPSDLIFGTVPDRPLALPGDEAISGCDASAPTSRFAGHFGWLAESGLMRQVANLEGCFGALGGSNPSPSADQIQSLAAHTQTISLAQRPSRVMPGFPYNGERRTAR